MMMASMCTSQPITKAIKTQNEVYKFYAYGFNILDPQTVWHSTGIQCEETGTCSTTCCLVSF